MVFKPPIRKRAHFPKRGRSRNSTLILCGDNRNGRFVYTGRQAQPEVAELCPKLLSWNEEPGNSSEHHLRPQGNKQLPPSVVRCKRPETEVVEPSASADRNPEISQGMAAGRSLSRSERKAAARAEFLRQEEQRERRRQVLRGCRKSRRAVLLEAPAWQHAPSLSLFSSFDPGVPNPAQTSS